MPACSPDHYVTMNKKIFVIAGPNGAGKTTAAQTLLSNSNIIFEYLNADEIAKGLAPLHPESVALQASKLMLQRLFELLDSNKSFAFETTASATNLIRHLKKAQSNHYEVHLLFLWLSSPDLAVKRVATRVAQGGHNIPEDTIRRRYVSGLRNLITHYLPLADKAHILDNSSSELNKVIAVKNKNNLKIQDLELWEEIQKVGNDKIQRN